MRKSQAYSLLAVELENWRLLPIEDVLSYVDGPVLVTTKVFSGEIIEIDISVRWQEKHKKQVCIKATAFGPSTWKTERIEESFIRDA